MLHSYTELLGKTLITARFTLLSDERQEIIYLGDTLIKKYPATKYSLKAVKRYCRLYLRDQAAKPKPRQLELPQLE